MTTIKTTEEIFTETQRFFDEHDHGISDEALERFRRTLSLHPDYWFVDGYQKLTIKFGHKRFAAVKVNGLWFAGESGEAIKTALLQRLAEVQDRLCKLGAI